MGAASASGNANDTDSRIKRKELTGKIPSTTSIHSFSKQQQVAGSNVPSSTLTNISSNSAAAQLSQMASNTAAGSITQ